MTREEAKTAISNLIDVFRKEYPNGGAFAAIQATSGHSLINKIYDEHEANLTKACQILEGANLAEIDRHLAECKTKDERIAELGTMVQKMKCCMNCDGQGDREDNYYCFLVDCDDNLSLWRLKDNK